MKSFNKLPAGKYRVILKDGGWKFKGTLTKWKEYHIRYIGG